MKVLMITRHIPFQPRSGIEMRIYNLLSCLTKVWDVSCIFLVDDMAENDSKLACCDLPVENHLIVNKKRGTISRYLFHLAELFIVGRKQKDEINSLIQRCNPDVIWLEFGYLGNLIPFLRKHDRPIIYSTHNCQCRLDKHIWQANKNRAYRLKMAPFIMLYHLHERIFLKMSDQIFCISKNDMNYYSKTVSKEKLKYLPFFFEDNSIQGIEPLNVGHPYVCIVGSLRSYQNYEAALFAIEELWPPLHIKEPRLQLYIIGDLPPQESPEYHHLMQKLRSRSNIVLTGQVSSVIPYVKGALVNIAPLFTASGVRTKIIESVACRTPVVSTTIGAEGLPFIDGESICLADSSNLIQEKVLELVNNPRRRQDVAEKAYRIYSEEFSLCAGVRRLASIESQIGMASERH